MDKKRDIVKDIFFNEIINEAKTGEIRVNTDVFNVGFNSCIEGNLSSGNFGDSKPILMINNSEQFITLLCDYVNECDKHDNMFSNYDIKTRIKGYLSLVWSNAVYEDFASPLLFLKKRIGFYQDKSLVFNNEVYANITVSSVLQEIDKETPYVFQISLENIELANISYGIYNEECYIYTLENKLGDPNINVIALNIFFDVLNKYNIEQVKVVSLLPVRYNSKESAFEKKYEDKLKQKEINEDELKKLLLEYKLENLNKQKSLCEDFISDFKRLEQCSNCIITSFPMEFDEYMHISVRDFYKNNSNALNDLLNEEICIYK